MFVVVVGGVNFVIVINLYIVLCGGSVIVGGVGGDRKFRVVLCIGGVIDG